MAEKQAPADMMQQWMNLSQRMWNTWLSANRNLGKGPEGLNAAYHENLQASRKLVNDTLELEQDLLEMWQEQIHGEQAAEPLGQLMGHLAKSAVETRSRLWDVFFDRGASVDLSKVGEPLEKISNPQDWLNAWRELGEQLMAAQWKVAETAQQEASPSPDEANQKAADSSGETKTASSTANRARSV